MASISKRANGRRMVQFVGKDGKRRSIYLGKISQRNAEAVKTRVESLVVASVTGNPLDRDTARWVSSLDDVLSAKLERGRAGPEAIFGNAGGVFGEVHCDEVGCW